MSLRTGKIHKKPEKKKAKKFPCWLYGKFL